MSRRLPRVRKVLSYSKGHGGDLERAMDALGPSADSPEELRRIFILGVTAHLAGYSTHRDSKGEKGQKTCRTHLLFRKKLMEIGLKSAPEEPSAI